MVAIWGWLLLKLQPSAGCTSAVFFKNLHLLCINYKRNTNEFLPEDEAQAAMVRSTLNIFGGGWSQTGA